MKIRSLLCFFYTRRFPCLALLGRPGVEASLASREKLRIFCSSHTNLPFGRDIFEHQTTIVKTFICFDGQTLKLWSMSQQRKKLICFKWQSYLQLHHTGWTLVISVKYSLSGGERGIGMKYSEVRCRAAVGAAAIVCCVNCRSLFMICGADTGAGSTRQTAGRRLPAVRARRNRMR